MKPLIFLWTLLTTCFSQVRHLFFSRRNRRIFRNNLGIEQCELRCLMASTPTGIFSFDESRGVVSIQADDRGRDVDLAVHFENEQLGRVQVNARTRRGTADVAVPEGFLKFARFRIDVTARDVDTRNFVAIGQPRTVTVRNHEPEWAIDEVTRKSVSGWLRDGLEGDRVIDVVSESSGSVIASVVANEFRPDVPTNLHQPQLSPNVGFHIDVPVVMGTSDTITLVTHDNLTGKRFVLTEFEVSNAEPELEIEDIDASAGAIIGTAIHPEGDSPPPEVTVYRDGIEIGTTTADDDGRWRLAVARSVFTTSATFTAQVKDDITDEVLTIDRYFTNEPAELVALGVTEDFDFFIELAKPEFVDGELRVQIDIDGRLAFDEVITVGAEADFRLAKDLLRNLPHEISAVRYQDPYTLAWSSLPLEDIDPSQLEFRNAYPTLRSLAVDAGLVTGLILKKSYFGSLEVRMSIDGHVEDQFVLDPDDDGIFELEWQIPDAYDDDEHHVLSVACIEPILDEFVVLDETPFTLFPVDPDLTVGDANRDGRFDTSDLVLVFQGGEYEDDVDGNSTWATGDWNADGEFDAGDLVDALTTGHYLDSVDAQFVV